MTATRSISVMVIASSLIAACGGPSAPTTATSAKSVATTPHSRVGAPAPGGQPAQPQNSQAAAPIDLIGADSAAREGHGWVWNRHLADEPPPCHTTLRLPDGRLIEPPPRVTTSGTRVSLSGGGTLKYRCTSSTSSAPSSPEPAFSITSAAAAFRDGAGYLWRDACGRTRLAVTATAVYTIPAAEGIPPGGVAVRPDHTLNTCHEHEAEVVLPNRPAQPRDGSSSPAKPTGWSHP